jgi:hypothetical protein
MSAPMTLTERLTAALPRDVLVKAQWALNYGWQTGNGDEAYAAMRAVLIAALLPVLEESRSDDEHRGLETRLSAIDALSKFQWTPAEGPTPAPGDALGTIETTWRSAALRVGEMLLSVGPAGYYGMTADQWLWWALHAMKAAPPDDTLARVARMTTDELTKMFVVLAERGVLDLMVSCGGKTYTHVKDIPEAEFDPNNCFMWFSPAEHEAVRPDAPEVK